MKSFLTHLECTKSQQIYDANELHNLSSVGAPLFARYDMQRAAKAFTRDDISKNENSLWRYVEMLPVIDPACRLTLGEGWTPLIKPEKWNEQIGCRELYIKDEAGNPTLSFKARGLAMAVSKALELGAQKIALPSAGNAASATAAYCAAAGIECHVFMPKDTPEMFKVECQALGAHVNLLDGLIHDCGKEVARRKEDEGWFDVSTLKEPYRVEGKKTMGYELAEQFDWQLPDVIIYPTGGGTGLIGMWKAFDEMQQLGWIGSKRPRMVSVQAAGCAPIVRAFEHGEEHAEIWQNAHTAASGLRVPVAVGDFLMLRAIRESNGTAIAISDDEFLSELSLFGAKTGIVLCPEGAAAIVAAKKLLQRGWIHPDERVVIFNTGSGLKYQEALKMAV
ncbi:threonine synthase [candidate division KSB1 bacterium]|nr:threonine synthase [candidate division KSB1 bacterium]